MEIRSLKQTTLEEITRAFNEAFADYFIKLQYDEAGMALKMKAENIRLEYSAGAFENEQLCGFINVDEADAPTNKFLQSLNFKYMVRLFEMKMTVEVR